MEKSWKVKLYKLNGDGDWIDLGIGFLEFNGKQVNIKKENEETELILTYEVKDEDYHTQGETILTWVGRDFNTFALSFIEKSCVKEVLEEICRIQNRKLNEVKEEDELGCWIGEVCKDNLHDVLEEILVGPRVKVESEVLATGFVAKVGNVFKEIEKADKPRLHLIFLIYKQLSNCYLVHLNSIKIIDILINEEFTTFIEALKYDPSLEGVEFDLIPLYTSSSFINALNIQDEQTLKKIEKINKLMFIKDTALTRQLEDHTNTFLILELQSSLKDLLTIYIKDSNMRKSLYEKLESKETKALKFLIDICSVSKMCSVQERHCLFDTFFHDGILNIVEKNSNEGVEGYLEFIGELFTSVIDISPFIIRNLFFNGNDQLGVHFLKHIAQELVKSSDFGTIQDLSKLLKTVVDPDLCIFETIRPLFYEEILPILINFIKQGSYSDTFLEILDIFAFCIEKHTDKTDLLKILSELIPKLQDLISMNKHIAVHVLKIIKAVIVKNDKSLNLFLLRKKVFDKVLSVLETNSVQENLLFSISLCICLKVVNSNVFSQLSKNISECLKRVGLKSLAVQFDDSKKSLFFNQL